MSRLKRSLIASVGAVALSAGVLAFAIPRYLAAYQRSHFRRCLGDMRTIGFAIEAYEKAHGNLPPLQGRHAVGDLTPYLVPSYIRVLPDTDTWNQPFLCRFTGATYEVWSLGSDGRDGSNTIDGPTEGWEADVLLRNGQFIRYPSFVHHLVAVPTRGAT